jgi:hypothetical protein
LLGAGLQGGGGADEVVDSPEQQSELEGEEGSVVKAAPASLL